jgi:hypothetical protein
MTDRRPPHCTRSAGWRAWQVRDARGEGLRDAHVLDKLAALRDVVVALPGLPARARIAACLPGRGGGAGRSVLGVHRGCWIGVAVAPVARAIVPRRQVNRLACPRVGASRFGLVLSGHALKTRAEIRVHDEVDGRPVGGERCQPYDRRVETTCRSRDAFAGAEEVLPASRRTGRHVPFLLKTEARRLADGCRETAHAACIPYRAALHNPAHSRGLRPKSKSSGSTQPGRHENPRRAGY